MTSHTQSKGHLRAWQRMLSGRRLDLLDPKPEDIEITDIAYGLARVARWNGQTTGEHPFSVAQHSLIVEEIFVSISPSAPKEARLMALLHDAPEYVIGDLISPFKAAIGLDYKAIEMRLLCAVHVRFGLPENTPQHIARMIKQADKIAAFYEATCLAGFTRHEAIRIFGSPEHVFPEELASRLCRLEAYETAAAHEKFMQKFNELVQAHATDSKTEI